MSTTPTVPATTNLTELQQLQAQVATLRTELADLKRFFSISKPDPDEAERGEQPSLVINCSAILLQHHETPGKHQVLLAAGEDGPCLSLFGTDDKVRLKLELTKNSPTCELFGKDLKRGVQLWVDDENGRGQLVVYDTAQPRAFMKAMENGGGAVTVTHDDGTPRACMTSSAHDGGEFLAVTPDLQVGVKITGAAPDGGAVVVNRLNGKPAVIVGTTPSGGAVLIKDPKGNIIDSLPRIPPAKPEED